MKTVFQLGDNLIVNRVIGENYGSYVPSIVSAFIILCFVSLLLGGIDKRKISQKEKRISVAYLFIGIVLVMTTFLFVYSGFEKGQVSTIGGLQGRYFLPLYIGGAFIPAGHVLDLKESQKYRLLFGMIALNVVSLLCRCVGLSA